MEYRRLYIDHIGPFSIESARQAACPSGTDRPSGGLVNGPDSEQLCGFSEANTIEPFEDVWFPCVCPLAGQAASYQASDANRAGVATHPPAHISVRGKYGMYGIGERGQEVALSNGEMHRAE